MLGPDDADAVAEPEPRRAGEEEVIEEGEEEVQIQIRTAVPLGVMLPAVQRGRLLPLRPQRLPLVRPPGGEVADAAVHDGGVVAAAVAGRVQHRVAVVRAVDELGGLA